MAGFKRYSVPDLANETRTIDSIAVAQGDLMMADRTTGTVVAATDAGTVTLMHGGGIAAKAVASGATELEITPIDLNTIYEVESNAVSNASHRYMRMEVTDTNTVNNSGTDDGTNGVVYQVGELGTVGTDKRILVKFLPGLT